MAGHGCSQKVKFMHFQGFPVIKIYFATYIVLNIIMYIMFGYEK